MTVSLEAIFLALFVLASQNRLAHQSDKRAHLDLQVNLLAEREMTAVLQLLQDIAAHLDVPMQWLIDRLLLTSSPTTCPHGRPVILRLTMHDIERGFHRI